LEGNRSRRSMLESEYIVLDGRLEDL